MKKHFYLLSLSFFLLSCGGGGSSGSTSFDRQTMLSNITSTVISPTYSTFFDEGATVDEKANTFCSTLLEEDLTSLQTSWKEIRSAWMQAEGFPEGSSDFDTLRLSVDYFPVNTAQIEIHISNLESGTPSEEIEIGADARGLGGLEYLLFDPANGNTAILEKLSNTSRCTYLKLVTTKLKEDALLVKENWDPSVSSSLAFSLSNPGDSSSSYASIQQGLSDVIISMSNLLANIRSNKLKSTETESSYSNQSVEDIIQNLEGIEKLFDDSNTENLNLYGLLISVGRPSLAQEILTKISETKLALSEIPLPLKDSIENNDPSVANAYTSVKDLHVLIAVDMASLFGISASFSDNDGD